jgi:hypothetical protein
MNEDPIQGYFAFEEDDLVANRAGRLSEKQSQRIKRADQLVDGFLLALSLIFFTATIFVGLIAFFSENSTGLWIAAILLLLIAMWLFRGARTEVDDTVQKAQGEVNFIKVEKQTGSVNDPATQRRRVTGYEMRVGDEVFANINPAAVECMRSGTYVVYFTKTTKQILSVEQISNGQ